MSTAALRPDGAIWRPAWVGEVMGMENREIAAVFEEISNLIKIIQDDPKWPFKSAAYDRAKRSIESYPERLEDIARSPNRKLTEIPGVGENPAHPARPLAIANHRPAEGEAFLQGTRGQNR
jgi:hypothetical protein